MIYPFTLCGGSGTKLWRLSRKSFLKQFVPLIAGKNVIGAALERFMETIGVAIVGNLLCLGATVLSFLRTEGLQVAESKLACSSEIKAQQWHKEMVANAFVQLKQFALLKRHSYQVNVSVE